VSTPRRHLGGGAVASVIADVGPLAAAGVLSIVLARAIGPSGNGEYALLATIVNLAVLVFSLGLTVGITYYVSRGEWPPGRAFRETYAAAVVLGVVAIAAGLGFYALTKDSVLEAFDTPIVLIALAAIPGFLAAQFASAIVLGQDRYEGFAALQLTTALVTLFVGVGLAITLGLDGAIAGLTAAGTATALVGAFLLRRGSGGHAPGHPLRKAIRFGLPGWIGNIFQQANYRFDVLILAAYASTAEVGLYSVALTLTSLAWVLPHGLQTVIFPRAASLDAAAQAGDLTHEESDAAVTRGTRHSVLLLLPAGLIVAVLLALVPLVYGREFGQTVALGFVLLPGVLALGAGKVLASVLTGRGWPRYNLYTGVGVAIVTVGLYFLLIPRFGEWGAAAASSASYLATAVLSAIFFRTVLGISLTTALIPTSADLRNYPEAFHALRAHLRRRQAA
jgi:O-antigen/teichoic acid export membrane protein